jgi:hypothetical protein
MADIVSMADIVFRHGTGVATVTDPTHDDLAKLRQEHPCWSFGTVWATANTGPDQRRIWASRNGIILSAWNAAELAEGIKRELAGEITRNWTSP